MPNIRVDKNRVSDFAVDETDVFEKVDESKANHYKSS